ncbi:hypothetical protein BDW02DRAFT_603327 [Decorospora gaudefroyi]|uniref:Uncharacterized protein n=1 Tax=Decorospora gaudefroyi TaxID=184978 RepID=A0A6A5K532_9PLEO|nr:hypothetical protein BDW02DRAFT_603327 [Decorospora gaudefroyi]
MARFQFRHGNIWGDAPITPTRACEQEEKDDLDEGAQTPCIFMPQPSAPMMVASSTTRRSIDERAIRMFMPGQNSFQEDAKESLEGGEEDGDQNSDGPNEHPRTYLDINKTPITPPKTPLTPSTETSVGSVASFFSLGFFTAVVVHLRVSQRGIHALLYIFALLVASAMLLTVCGNLSYVAEIAKPVGWAWNMLVPLNAAIEMAIEGNLTRPCAPQNMSDPGPASLRDIANVVITSITDIIFFAQQRYHERIAEAERRRVAAERAEENRRRDEEQGPLIGDEEAEEGMRYKED